MSEKKDYSKYKEYIEDKGPRKKLSEYSDDELKELYKRYDLYCVTEYMKFFLKNKYPEYNIEGLIFPNFKIGNWASSRTDSIYPRWINDWIDTMWMNSVSISTVNDLMSTDNYYKSNKERNRDDCKRYTMTIANECIMLFVLKEFYDNGTNPDYEDFIDTLYMNDDFDLQNGIATKLQMLDFIWNTLRWCKVKELEKLLKFSDNHFIMVRPGRPSKETIIKMIDVESEECIERFKNRNDIINTLGIKKNNLSMCLKSSSEHPKSKSLWRKWKDEDGKKYWFIEVGLDV